MSFFILVKNSIHEHEFSYLSDKKIKPLSDTQITQGREKVHHFHKNHQGALVLAKDLMSKKIKTLTVGHKVYEAKQLMDKFNIHHIPVSEHDRICGLISSSDVQGLADDILLKDEQLEHIMTNTVLCVSEETPLQHILEVFVHEYVHSLPVVDADLYLVGIITQTDIFKWILKHEKYKK